MLEKLTFASIVAKAEERKCPIWEIVLEQEEKAQEIDRQLLWQRMQSYWEIMLDSIRAGVKIGNESLSGLVGDEGAMMIGYLQKGQTLAGETTVLAVARALGVACINASMGKIVAVPTAGSCGILPAVIKTVAEKTNAKEKQIIGALFTAAGIGQVIEEVVSTAGAQAGCQAECGSATCMAAVAAVELAGGSPGQAAHAGAMALKNIMGLVCDPVAGLVEIPCVKRNAMGASNALMCADMALAGIESKIPIDEVILAMKEVGDLLPSSLKETARGGLANTPTARDIEKRVLS